MNSSERVPESPVTTEETSRLHVLIEELITPDTEMIREDLEAAQSELLRGDHAGSKESLQRAADRAYDQGFTDLLKEIEDLINQDQAQAA